jgi:hypothetical protein
MITLQWRGEQDLYKNLIKFERRVTDNTSDFVRFAARWLEMDIRTHWSMKKPSDAGNPPAMDTGNLDSAVRAEPQGRDLGGRFGTDTDSMAWYVRVDTANGEHPENWYGTDRGGYGQALENGVPSRNLKPRPFMKPAIDRLRQTFPEMALREIRK